jgi:two-component system sensor histidine kinase KdpD
VLLAAGGGLLLRQGAYAACAPALYFIAVVISAAAFGVWCGLLAALSATLLVNFASSGPLLHLALGRRDLANLVVFVCGAWGAGLYVDEARRERAALARLMRPPAVASRAVLRLIELAFFTWAPLGEAVRVLAAILLSAASFGIGLIVTASGGALSVDMIYLAGTVVAAVILGARYALITAILNVLAYDFLVLVPRGSLGWANPSAGLSLIVFLAIGWQIGRFAERVRYERQAVRSLFDAGSSFSGAADEPDLRQLIAEAVSRLNGGRYVQVRDETGEVTAEAGPRPSAGLPRVSSGAAIELSDAQWRSRALECQARPLGRVAWLSAGNDPDRPVEPTIRALLDLGGAAIARARISRDNARLEAAAQAEELRRALLASISHDFRTPLAGILGAATSLVDLYEKYDDAVRRDLLLNIREQAYRLSRYVENLLAMSRVESQTLQAKLRPMLLEPFVFETWESIADGLHVARPELAVPGDIWVMADPVLLRQALANVLENAVKYTPPGCRVQVTGRRAKGKIQLSVSDFGPGAPDEDLDQLFNPFFRAKNSKAGGVGLGLFVTRSFVEAMGGTIKARRRAGAATGMIFEFSLAAAGGAA